MNRGCEAAAGEAGSYRGSDGGAFFMGMLIAQHEGYFESFFQHFNSRFGPTEKGSGLVWRWGGIAEIAALQKQFQIFRPDRPFIESAALLGLGGLASGPAKDRWIEYLGRLSGMETNVPGVNGDQLIVKSLADNLEQKEPLPCFMEAHDGRLREPGLVLVETGTPLFYLERTKFLVIKLPMRPMSP